MAVNVSFNGATIYRPGAYSHTKVDEGQSFPLGLTGIVLLIGESDGGVGILEDGNLSNKGFTSPQMNSIKAEYRGGPLVDACQFVFAPAADAAIPNGANGVYLAKTNSSTSSSLNITNSYGVITSKERGVGANRITFKSSLSAIVYPSITTTAISAFGAALDGVEVKFIINGEMKSIVLLEDLHDTIDDLIVELEDAFPELTISKVETNKIKFELVVANSHRLGYSLSLESVALASLGLVSKLVFSEDAAQTLQLVQKRDSIFEVATILGKPIIAIGSDIVGSSFEITENVFSLLVDSVVVSSFALAEYPLISELVEAINLYSPGHWSAELLDIVDVYASSSSIDKTSGACYSLIGKSKKIHKYNSIVKSFFETSGIVTASLSSKKGLIDETAETALSGGSKGFTTQESILAALEAAKKINANFIIPLFSQDSDADIALGLTSSSSVYEIDSIHLMVKNHINELKSIKNRMERQAVLSYIDSFDNCRSKAIETSDSRIQLVIQDIRQIDSKGNVKWFQPWALAALIAGARAGASVGEPLTYKILNTSDMRHADFNPDVQCDQAIQSGITFVEKPVTGGIRLVLDNTTYSRDTSWIWNRAACIYASDIAMQNWRTRMEAFVGRKNSMQIADVQLVALGVLQEFRNQGIIVGNPGFRDLSITMSGSVINCKVTLILVEGVEFILTESTVARNVQ